MRSTVDLFAAIRRDARVEGLSVRDPSFGRRRGTRSRDCQLLWHSTD